MCGAIHILCHTLPIGEVFVMDLGSTHGTFMNKKRLEPHMYVPLRIGSTVKLGLSSRSLCLMGSEDPPAPSDRSDNLTLDAEAQRLQVMSVRFSSARLAQVCSVQVSSCMSP